MDRFVNRTNELSRLQTLYESDDAELAVIFGRRRLGKQHSSNNLSKSTMMPSSIKQNKNESPPT